MLKAKFTCIKAKMVDKLRKIKVEKQFQEDFSNICYIITEIKLIKIFLSQLQAKIDIYTKLFDNYCKDKIIVGILPSNSRTVPIHKAC